MFYRSTYKRHYSTYLSLLGVGKWSRVKPANFGRISRLATHLPHIFWTRDHERRGFSDETVILSPAPSAFLFLVIKKARVGSCSVVA